MAVTLPAALLTWHWWKDGKVTVADLRRLAPLALVALVLGGIDLAYYSNVNVSLDYSPAQRVLIAAHALCFYAAKLLWPADLALLYAQWDLDPSSPAAWGYVIAVAGAVSALWFLRHRAGRGPLACVLFFAAALSPVLGFLDYGYMNISFVADRYQYLASAGLLVLAAGAAASGAGRLPEAMRKAVAGTACAVVLLLGAMTWTQSEVYRDDATLFDHAASTNTESWAAHYYAGEAFFKQGRYARAEKHLRRSLERGPRHGFDRHRRGTLQKIAETFRLRGRFAEAVEAYRDMLREEPGYANAHAGLGVALFRLRRHAEAAAALERSLSLPSVSGRTGPPWGTSWPLHVSS